MKKPTILTLGLVVLCVDFLLCWRGRPTSCPDVVVKSPWAAVVGFRAVLFPSIGLGWLFFPPTAQAEDTVLVPLWSIQ